VGWNPQDPQGNFQADEFTQMQSFDAIRATLDFNPWTLDFVYSKIREGATNPEDDRDLTISYITYKIRRVQCGGGRVLGGGVGQEHASFGGRCRSLQFRRHQG